MTKIIADTNIPFVAECFSSLGRVEAVNGRQITPDVIGDADALIVRSITPVNEGLLDGSPVTFVGTATIGFDHVDLDYLDSRGIAFASAPGSNADSAAEYIIAALLEICLRHDIGLQGKSIGIIGVGNVGGRVARKCEALGMRIVRNDPPLQRQTGDPAYVSLDQVFDCDFVTLHTPLTFEGPDKTFHLADEGFFKSLRPGCVFFNASRGAVVDSAALKGAIRTGHLRSVALDVWEDEPDIDVELLKIVDLGTPHIAGYSLDGKVAGMMMIYRALCEHLGVVPKYDSHDFLPEPAVPELHLQANDARDEHVLAEAVRAIYDIRSDDAALRQIICKAPDERGPYFDSLRKNYPVRREFHNTTISLKGDSIALAAKLEGIGFGSVRVDGA